MEDLKKIQTGFMFSIKLIVRKKLIMKKLLILFILTLFSYFLSTANNYSFFDTKLVKVVSDSFENSYRPLDTYNGDTAKYIKENFISRKMLFIGKPLDSLMKVIEIKPYTYINDLVEYPDHNFRPANDPSKSYKVLLYLLKTNTGIDNIISDGLEGKFHRHPSNTIGILTIEWEYPLPRGAVDSIRKSDKQKWGDISEAYFGKQILKEISFN